MLLKLIQNMRVKMIKVRLLKRLLSHPRYLFIIDQLKEKDMSVLELTIAFYREAGIEVMHSTVSSYLKVFRDCNVVRTIRKGKRVYYSLDVGRLIKLDMELENLIKSINTPLDELK